MTSYPGCGCRTGVALPGAHGPPPGKLHAMFPCQPSCHQTVLRQGSPCSRPAAHADHSNTGGGAGIHHLSTGCGRWSRAVARVLCTHRLTTKIFMTSHLAPLLLPVLYDLTLFVTSSRMCHTWTCRVTCVPVNQPTRSRLTVYHSAAWTAHLVR